MSKYFFKIGKYPLSFVLAVLVGIGALSAQSDRPIDGYGYNEMFPSWGATGDIQPRFSPSDFADGISEPKLDAVYGKVNPRIISNALFAQDEV